MGLTNKRYRKGGPLLAADVAEERAELVRLGRITGGPGITVHNGSGGIAIGLDRSSDPFWIRLTSSASSGAYAWVEVERNDAHGWITTDTTGTAALDGAREQNGDATLTSGTKVYPASRSSTSGEVIFEKV